jgi:hypothetical protein
MFRKSPVGRGTHFIKKIKIIGFDTEIMVGESGRTKSWKPILEKVSAEGERLYQMAVDEFQGRKNAHTEVIMEENQPPQQPPPEMRNLETTSRSIPETNAFEDVFDIWGSDSF